MSGNVPRITAYFGFGKSYKICELVGCVSQWEFAVRREPPAGPNVKIKAALTKYFVLFLSIFFLSHLLVSNNNRHTLKTKQQKVSDALFLLRGKCLFFIQFFLKKISVVFLKNIFSFSWVCIVFKKIAREIYTKWICLYVRKNRVDITFVNYLILCFRWDLLVDCLCWDFSLDFSFHLQQQVSFISFLSF